MPYVDNHGDLARRFASKLLPNPYKFRQTLYKLCTTLYKLCTIFVQTGRDGTGQDGTGRPNIALLPIALFGCIRRPGCILPPNAYCLRMHTASECILPLNAFGRRMHSAAHAMGPGPGPGPCAPHGLGPFVAPSPGPLRGPGPPAPRPSFAYGALRRR